MEEPLLGLSHAGHDIITVVLRRLPLEDRFICSLVCKAWAEAATAATCIILRVRRRVPDVSCLQTWLEKHGKHVKVLQLHAGYGAAQLTAVPCFAKLQDLLLQGTYGHFFSIASKTWGDIASATQLTSLALSQVQTASQQADPPPRSDPGPDFCHRPRDVV